MLLSFYSACSFTHIYLISPINLENVYNDFFSVSSLNRLDILKLTLLLMYSFSAADIERIPLINVLNSFWLTDNHFLLQKVLQRNK
jgi:hypothetical protein